MRLIEEHFMIAGLSLPDLDKKWVQIVNDYTLVVQEYFQERVKLWLSTVGEVSCFQDQASLAKK
jgi:hypothetical protein